MSLPVYSRASLSRTAATVVALVLTATASAVAREFRAADTQSEDCPTVQALRYMSRMIAERGVRPPSAGAASACSNGSDIRRGSSRAVPEPRSAGSYARRSAIPPRRN